MSSRHQSFPVPGGGTNFPIEAPTAAQRATLDGARPLDRISTRNAIASAPRINNLNEYGAAPSELIGKTAVLPT